MLVKTVKRAVCAVAKVALVHASIPSCVRSVIRRRIASSDEAGRVCNDVVRVTFADETIDGVAVDLRTTAP